jgi:phage head maturation protease
MNETLVELVAEPDIVVETRSAQVADVSFPKRIVTVIAMPYEQPALIHTNRRSFTEVVTRGAFDGIEKRASRIRAFRDHDYRDVVGKIMAAHPSRSEGLVTEVRMFATDIGERTLIECDEDGLSASAGFGLLRRDDGHVWDDAEVWESNRAVRRLNRLWLDHLAFVPNPAYPGAKVLDVRDASERPQEPVSQDATPNRDRIVLDQLRAQRDALDARWLR